MDWLRQAWRLSRRRSRREQEREECDGLNRALPAERRGVHAPWHGLVITLGRLTLALAVVLGLASSTCTHAAEKAAGAGAGSSSSSSVFDDGLFQWKASRALIDPGPGLKADDPHIAVKDPSVVWHEGKWHMFATVRMKSRRVAIEYLQFADWNLANKATRHVLDLHDQYYCAPQVFFFGPQRKWYLIYQLSDRSRSPAFGPFFSTAEKGDDPKAWTKPAPMVTNAPADPKWLDFWVICDLNKAHLFYTSLDGSLWRRETELASFPLGWSEPVLALNGDIFEASHTYKLAGREQYLTVVEAQGDGFRYYKAYVASSLVGPWKGLADTESKPFASRANVALDSAWTANISHGEILRAGIDEHLEIDPAHMKFVFQGASDRDYKTPGYGGIPWKLGILELK